MSKFSFILLLLGACTQQADPGFLLVSGQPEVTYDIYRVSGENPLQFLSEQIGHMERPVSLGPGRYLVLADCSSELITIKSGVTEKLVTRKLTFIPPKEVSTDDLFSIQCERFSRTGFKQSFKNKYELNVLTGTHKLLVSMTPLQIRVDKDLGQENLEFSLAGVVVSEQAHLSNHQFFVSPHLDKLAVTESQDFNKWQYLLPGKYDVTVNSSTETVELAKGDLRSLSPGHLKVLSPKELDLTFNSNLTGQPVHYTLNEDRYFELNRIYPVLPGSHDFKVTGTLKPRRIQIVAGETLTIPLRATIVDSGCAPFQWTCLGATPVFIFKADTDYPYVKGLTDVPILYEGDDVWLSIGGTRDVKHAIPNNKSLVLLQATQVNFRPVHHPSSTVITDLARIEGTTNKINGHSLDFDLEKESEALLIYGNYQFAFYHATIEEDGPRNRHFKPIRVQSRDPIEVKFPVYVSEKKIMKLQADEREDAQRRQRRIARIRSSYLRPLMPPIAW